MIVDVPYVKVSGIKYPVYAVDYSTNQTGVSKLVIDFVANTEYLEPLLNTKNPTIVNISGVLTFSGYPVSSSITETLEGKVMQVTYYDTSILLDKIYVGLHGVHGDSKNRQLRTELSGNFTIPVPEVSGVFSNMVLVGDYVDPCEGIGIDYIDPCDACPSASELTSVIEGNTSKFIDCRNEIYTRILDVRYTLSQLIAALSIKGIKFSNVPVINANYYGRFTGTAREVLSSWCSELGLTFIWEDSTVKFIDLKSGIIINDSSFYNDCQLVSRTVSRSIENNSYQGNIYYFGGEGRIIENDCSGKNTYRLTMVPITLKDIFWSFIDDGSGGGRSAGLSPYISKFYTDRNSGLDIFKDNQSIEGLQFACMLSYYSEELRDLFLLYYFYGVTSLEDLVSTNRKLPLLGIEEVLEVNNYSEASEEFSGSEPADRIYFNELTKDDRKFCKANNGRLLKIKYNQTYHTRFKEFEKNLAKEFIGRYWISYLSDRNYQISGPDGTPVFYSTGGSINLPFIDLLPESIRATSVFINKILKQTRDANSPSGEITTTVNKKFILLDRKPAWEPTSVGDSFANVDKILRKLSPYYISPFKSRAGDATESNLKHEEVYILAYNKPSSLNLSISGPIYHPVETANKNIKTDASDFGAFNTYYGLRESSTKRYDISMEVPSAGGDPTVIKKKVYLPTQSYSDFGISFSGYTVLATPKPLQVITKSLLKKKEIIIGDCPTPFGINSSGIDNTVSTEIVFRDLSTYTSSVIESAGGTCGYSSTLIKSLMNEYKSSTARRSQVEALTKSYELQGVPTRAISLSDGLSSFSIRINDNGISSSITFSNLPKSFVSQEAKYEEVKRNQLRRLAKLNPVSSSNKINL